MTVRAFCLLGWQRLLARTRQGLLGQFNRIRAVFLPEPYRSVLPYTMVRLKRLRALDELTQRLGDMKIPGDIVECGTCNGGSGAVLAHAVRRSRQRRHVWLLDSFDGLPAAGSEDGPLARCYAGLCRGSPERVRQVMKRVGVSEEAITVMPGWFRDTLPVLPVSCIALLHIDADWYESVREVLGHLYDRVAVGGYVVLDDFGYWQGCRRACLEFLTSQRIRVELTDVDGIGVYFQKPR